MSERRSISQVLFGYLPEQTVDVRGGVWKVEEWRGALPVASIDERALRRELCRIARPWSDEGRDGGFVRELERGARVVVRSLDRDRGVRLRRFPEVYYCKSCRRMHDAVDARCRCGAPGRKAQLHFVLYCSETGELREPNIRYCPDHDASRVNFPGTASGREIRFDCPDCGRHLRNGLGAVRSSSNALMSANVHRAASVYTPRSVVVVNPPSAARVREIQEAGGAPRTLEWVLDGLDGSPTAATPTREGLHQQLLASGFAPAAVEAMVAASGLPAAGRVPSGPALGAETRETAEEQAFVLALGLSEGRTTLSRMAEQADPGMRTRYVGDYPAALRFAGLERVDFVDRFPVLTGHFGYTRGPSGPGEARLQAFRERRGDYVVYGDLVDTEALWVGLDPNLVAEWLGRKGHRLPTRSDSRSARLAVLSALGDARNDREAVLRDATTLVHSYAHRFLRMAAVHAGIELSALSELLVPMHLGFFAYAAARGDFVLGGLQALFENDLHILLHDFAEGEHRCALDPGCSRGGGACTACLHLGEPSCRLFNGHLDRSTLAGPGGYLSIPRER